ncbi:unnamed protein product [Coffea canephora]|uniref:Uncharacterized protein n=1 Tax=Coffea canephora TaxID=49390 RepID=A0A068VAF2_COFCA|nr:unnamed protein product [Coffea canephora]
MQLEVDIYTPATYKCSVLLWVVRQIFKLFRYKPTIYFLFRDKRSCFRWWKNFLKLQVWILDSKILSAAKPINHLIVLKVMMPLARELDAGISSCICLNDHVSRSFRSSSWGSGRSDR